MNKASKGLSFFIKKFLIPSIALFGLFVLLFFISPKVESIKREKIFVLLFAAVGIVAAALLFYIPKMNLYFKVATHFVAMCVVLLGILYFSDYMQTGNWVLILVAFVILYAIFCPVVLLLYHLAKKKKQPESEYKPLYK